MLSLSNFSILKTFAYKNEKIHCLNCSSVCSVQINIEQECNDDGKELTYLHNVIKLLNLLISEFNLSKILLEQSFKEFCTLLCDEVCTVISSELFPFNMRANCGTIIVTLKLTQVSIHCHKC